MRATIFRILRNGIFTAIALAILGYMMSEFAGMWLASTQTARTTMGNPTATAHEIPGSGTNITQQLRSRLPVTMAAWGFALVAIFESIAAIWRGQQTFSPPSRAAKSACTPTNDLDPEVEKLLNQLLEQADATREAEAKLTRGKLASSTPVSG